MLEVNRTELLTSLEIATREQPRDGDYASLATLKVINKKWLSDKLQMVAILLQGPIIL